MQELYDIPGTPTNPRFAGGLLRQAISGWSAIGRQESNPQFQNPFVWNPRFNFSWVRGRQTWKAGYEYQAIATEIDDVHPKYGRDTYGGQYTRPSGAASDSATFNLADFLLGLRSNYAVVTPFIFNLRQRMHFFYVQNDWKLTPKLTLNAGLRYEFATPQWERDNYLTNFDPQNRSLIQAKDGSIYDRALVHPDRNNFAPRLGLAYSLTPSVVVRAGYGVSYVHFNRLGGENLLSFNGPHVVELNITQLPSQGLCVGNAEPTSCFRTTMMGYPTGYNVPSRFDPLKARVNFIPSDTRTGYVQSWHLTVQKELVRNLLLDVGYIGNRSTKLLILGDYNQARPNNTGESLSLQARRPLSAYQAIQIAFPGGSGNYHAMQAKLERRFTSGFYALNSLHHRQHLLKRKVDHELLRQEQHRRADRHKQAVRQRRTQHRPEPRLLPDGPRNAQGLRPDARGDTSGVPRRTLQPAQQDELPASGNRSSSAFGTISSTFPARQIQFGLKLHF